MSKREPELYFQDIIVSIKKIESYLEGRTYEKFVNDGMAMDAVVRNIEIVGEAANNISEETKRSHPEIPWGKITGMRNKIIHEYFGIDMEILWQTIQEDLRELRQQVEAIVKS